MNYPQDKYGSPTPRSRCGSSSSWEASDKVSPIPSPIQLRYSQVSSEQASALFQIFARAGVLGIY